MTSHLCVHPTVRTGQVSLVTVHHSAGWEKRQVALANPFSHQRVTPHTKKLTQLVRRVTGPSEHPIQSDQM